VIQLEAKGKNTNDASSDIGGKGGIRLKQVKIFCNRPVTSIESKTGYKTDIMLPDTLLPDDSTEVAEQKAGLTANVTLRGTRDGVVIVLGDGDWNEIMADLTRQLDRPNAAAFFRGAQVSVETGARFLQENERLELERILDAHGIHLGAANPTVSRPPATAPKEQPETYTRTNGTLEALMIKRTLRSGQIIRHPGPVVVYGDVNDGAEIVAAGDVLIFGRLRGLVHAGAGGDEHATIGALSLNPPQLRIGSHIARSPEEKKKKPRGPEMACVRDGQIVIEPWRV